MPSVPTPDQLAGLDPRDHITRDHRRELARLGRASLYFFARYIFGCTGLNERAHRPLCDFAQSVITTPGGFGVAEDPRGTGKSHAVTIPGPAWCLIQREPDCHRRGWLPLGPSANILVVSYKTIYAGTFVNDTRRRMETQPIFRWLYDDIIPSATSGPGASWTKEMFTVVRESGSGHSVLALGTESGATSLHPVVMFIDDLVNEINYQSAAEIAHQVDWVSHSISLVEPTRGSRLIVENSWSERDVNYALRAQNVENPGRVKFFSRSIVVCDDCEGGRPLDTFGNPTEAGHSIRDHTAPERPLLDRRVKTPFAAYTLDDVAALERNTHPRVLFFAQFLNRPLNREDLKWREDWLRYYTLEESPGGSRWAVMLSGHGGLTGPRHVPDPSRLVHVPVDSMHIVAALDPGLRRPGLAVTGRIRVSEFGELLFILDASSDPLSPRDQFFLLFDWILKWNARNLVFENVALTGYLRDTIPTMAEAFERDRGRRLPHWIRRPNPESNRIIGAQVYRREGDKIARIDAGLSPFAEQRLIVTRRDLEAFNSEYLLFDRGRNLDVLDAVLMSMRAWTHARPPTAGDRLAAREDARRQHAEFGAAQGPSPVGYGEGV